MHPEFRDRNPRQVSSVVSSSRWGVMQPRAVISCQLRHIQEGNKLVSFEWDRRVWAGDQHC